MTIFKRCPAKVCDRETWDLLAAYRDYTRGFWPVAGGRVNQSRLFLFLIGVIESERGAIDEKREAEREAARGAQTAFAAMQTGA